MHTSTTVESETLMDTTRQAVDRAIYQMRNNVQQVGERGERLDAMQERTDDLATQANSFRRGANRLRKQMWWKDMKMRLYIILGIIVLLVIITVSSGQDTRAQSTCARDTDIAQLLHPANEPHDQTISLRNEERRREDNGSRVLGLSGFASSCCVAPVRV